MSSHLNMTTQMQLPGHTCLFFWKAAVQIWCTGVHNNAALHWMQLFFLGAEEQGTIPLVQRSSVWEYNLTEMVET